MKRLLWRTLLTARYVLFQRQRAKRVVLENFGGLKLVVLPGVFHPALYRTTPVFLRWIERELHPNGELRALEAAGATALEIGTGSGILATRLATVCQRVVATDISKDAVRCARVNALLNRVEHRMDVRHGDLYEPVSGERFEVVLFSPPYFRREPTTMTERAFFATDIRDRFAAGLQQHLVDHGRGFVLLSSDGDETGFLRSFRDAGLETAAVHRANLVSEFITIYRLSAER